MAASDLIPVPRTRHRPNDGLRVKLSKIEDLAGSRRLFAQPYLFQCPPLETFQHEHGRNHNVYTTATNGEFSQRGGKKLTTTTWRTLAVEWDGRRFVTGASYDVEKLRDRLILIAERGYAFRMLATHYYATTPELDIDAVLETVAVSEVAGEPDARYFDLTFREWRDPTVDQHNKKRKGGDRFPITVTLNDPHKSDPPRWTGLSHDQNEKLTFAYLAKIAYGQPSQAHNIARANDVSNWGMHDDLFKYPRFRKHGGTLKIPKLSARAQAQEYAQSVSDAHDQAVTRARG